LLVLREHLSESSPKKALLLPAFHARAQHLGIGCRIAALSIGWTDPA
jgi:hypothetical protein